MTQLALDFPVVPAPPPMPEYVPGCGWLVEQDGVTLITSEERAMELMRRES